MHNLNTYTANALQHRSAALASLSFNQVAAASGHITTLSNFAVISRRLDAGMDWAPFDAD